MSTQPTSCYPILIIGAGISGIAAGCQIKRHFNLTNFIIFESQDDVGGTWWNHRYPGVACDVPAPLYSFSFARYPGWCSFKPSGDEIRRYLSWLCDKYSLRDRIKFNSTVSEIRWNEEQKEWLVTVSVLTWKCGVKIDEEVSVRAKIVISAVGKFREPDLSILRDVPGKDNFQGDIMHTARWNDAVHLKEKDITVIGGGCSATQLVPELVKASIGAKSITQIIRSPHWVSPGFLSDRGRRWWKRYIKWGVEVVPGLAWVVRFGICAVTEMTYLLFYRPHCSELPQRKLERRLEAHLAREAPEKYREMLLPSYPVGCKRVISDDAGWLHCLHQKQLRLYGFPVKRFEQRALILANGEKEVKVPTDVLILATGYERGMLLQTLRITGRGGMDLQDMWRVHGGPQAYLGIAMDRFPNLFMLYGPNSSSGHTSVIIGIENNLTCILNLVRPVLEEHVSTVEVKEEARQKWTRMIQEATKKSVWVRGCSNWYIDEKRWNGMVYPYSQVYNYYSCHFLRRSDWSITQTSQSRLSYWKATEYSLWMALLSMLFFYVLFPQD